MLPAFMTGNRKWWSLGGGSLLLAAAATVALVGPFRPAADPFGLPPELSEASLKARAADPPSMMDTMRSTMERTDLSDEQREEIRRRMREAWQAQLDQRVDEYYAAAAEQKQEVLDRHLEEMQRATQEREARREEANEPREPRDERRRPDFASMTRQQRKARAESRDPDRAARQMAYFSALRARAEERGVRMPFGPGGGRFGGGPGGGPGGGRGGPR